MLYHYTSAFVLAICLISSIYSYVLHILNLYVWHVTFVLECRIVYVVHV